jgi:hypothetical protein
VDAARVGAGLRFSFWARVDWVEKSPT